MKTILISVTSTDEGEDFGASIFEDEQGRSWDTTELKELMAKIRKCDMSLDEVCYNVTYYVYDGEIPKEFFDDVYDVLEDYDQQKCTNIYWGGHLQDDDLNFGG